MRVALLHASPPGASVKQSKHSIVFTHHSHSLFSPIVPTIGGTLLASEPPSTIEGGRHHIPSKRGRGTGSRSSRPSGARDSD
ncbi:hypothetical protein VTJ04DRAFT_5216 [Mycothermus thermophilus]|uniref:uncharacterized protein n=1 Tax=Humicola insolens TaxID=85995 RepID=UPI0037438216